MPRLSKIERERAVGMLMLGTSQIDVGRRFGCSRATINRLWRRFQQTGSTADRPRPGHPRVTTPADDRYIRLLHLRNRKLTATSTNRTVFRGRLSSQTVRNRLRSSRLRARRPYIGLVYTPQIKRLRLRWCNNRVHWNQRTWNRVVFSDESRFSLSEADGRVRVWRRIGERYSDACVVERDRFGGGSVMVWGGICRDQKSHLIIVRGNMNAQRYINDVLQAEALPFLAQNGPGLTFQHDNATPHAARLTTNFLNANGVNVLPWPSRSPDLNPIEHLWDELGRRLRRHQPQPQNIQQLENALVQAWRQIPAYTIRRLIQSMRRRCQAVVNAHGSHTRY